MMIMEIIVKNIFGTYERTFLMEPRQTIYDLRQMMGTELNMTLYEVVLCGGPGIFPYPFANDMRLEALDAEHRTLFMIIKEDPEHAVPLRVRPERECLDLRELFEEDISYLKKWLVMRRFGEIRVRWQDPLLPRILHEIAPNIYRTNVTVLRFYGEPSTGLYHPPELWKELRYLLREAVRQQDAFRLVADPGILGNITDEQSIIMPEDLARVDLIAASFLREMMA